MDFVYRKHNRSIIFYVPIHIRYFPSWTANKNTLKETYMTMNKLAHILVSVSYQQMQDVQGHV